jgi:hypothetical protein
VPFVVPPSTTDLEALELDGLHLNSNEIGMTDVAFPPPRQRQEWIGAADAEHQLLVRDPLYENREITANLVVIGGDKDGMLQRVGEIVDKLQKASKTTDGVPLVWSPGGSTLEVTFDVLAGEITEMAVDVEWNLSHVAKLTVVMKAKPYWRGEETLTSTASSGATPFATMEIAYLIGDAPATGRLIVTDTASQSRRLVEWGLEGPLTYNAATSLIIDSDSMTTAGFAGTGSTQAGAYDPGGAGNSVISLGLLNAQAMVGFSGAHSGAFRVKGRFYCNTADTSSTKIRLVWKDQDNPQTANSYVRPIVGVGWNRLDLGTITVSGSWSGYVEVQGPFGETLKLDFLELIPVSDGYGKARATYAYQAGVSVGHDGFSSSTAGAVLHTATSGRAAPTGGDWVTSGAAGDFVYADSGSEEYVTRTSGSPRYAILGSTNYTDIEVSAQAITWQSPVDQHTFSVIARWSSSTDHLFAWLTNGGTLLELRKVVGGSATSLAYTDVIVPAGRWSTLRLVVYSSGRAFATCLGSMGETLGQIEASDSALATGGALATGKPGFAHSSAGATPMPVDEFNVMIPATEPVVIYSGRTLTVSSDDTKRQNSAGTASGNPPSYHPAGRFVVPVGTSRVFAAARRNDTDSTLDDNVTDATQIQVGVTPRGLVVPRS